MANASTSAVQLGAINSNSSAVTAANTIASAAINHTFDFEANIYWVRVLIKRGATNETVTFTRSSLTVPHSERLIRSVVEHRGSCSLRRACPSPPQNNARPGARVLGAFGRGAAAALQWSGIFFD